MAGSREQSKDQKSIFDSSLEVPDRQYTKRRRHKSINDARDRVPETVLEVEKLLIENQIHPTQGHRALQRAIEVFSGELFWMLQQHPEGEEYLFQRDLGTMRLSPPTDIQGEVIGGEFVGEMPDTPTEFPHVQFRGLRSILTGGDKISGRFVIEKENHLSANEERTVVSDSYIPRHIIKEAFLACVEFLGKADFGIEFDEDRPLAKVTPDPAAETPPGIQRFEQTDLYKTNEKLTVTSNNDHLVVVSAGSRTPVSGTGKTTLATTIGKGLDTSESGFNAEEKATYTLSEFGYGMISSVEQGSAIILDEGQGTQSGTGLNARRSMKTETIDTINGMLNNRDKNLTIIIVFQDMTMADKNLQNSIDNWVLIKKGIEERNGPMATNHEAYKNDYEWGNTRMKTPALEDLTWDALPADDEDYATMEEMKQESKTKSQTNGEDEEEEIETLADLPKHTRDEMIRLAADPNVGQKEIAEELDLTQASVSRIVSGDQ